MKSKSLFTKLFSYIFIFSIILACMCGFVFAPKSIIAAAASVSNYTNNEFNLYNSNNVPDSFTASGNLELANVSAGVVDLFDNKYKKFEHPEIDQKNNRYALRISSFKEKDDETEQKSHSAHFGFTTNNSVSFAASGYYRITVSARTDINAGIGALYLFDADNDNEVVAQINSIDSLGWQDYYFFISTDETTTLNLKLGLYLHGDGTVLFDRIRCDVSSAEEIKYFTTVSSKNQYAVLDNSTKNVDKFEFDLTKKPFEPKTTPTGGNYNADYIKTDKNTNSTAYDGVHNWVFKLDANDGYVAYATTDNTFNKTPSEEDGFESYKLGKNSLYKISVTAKASNISTGNAFLQLVETENNYESERILISGSTNYQTYSFYVRTFDELAPLQLVIGLGDNGSNASGIFYVSNFYICKINYATYSSASSDIKKFDLVSAAKKIADSENNTNFMPNGNFNAMEVNDVANPYPAGATNWQISADKNAVQKYGIVNTSSAEWDKLKNSYNYDRLSKPYNDKDENVLMMYNSGAQTLSYTSDTKNLSANANYTFMMDVQPQYGNLTIELVCTVDGNEIVLASYEAEQIVAAYNWQTVRFNIKTGYQPLNVAIRFTIKNASTYAYVDNVYYNYTTYGVNNIKNVEVDLSEITNFFTGAENKQIAFKGKFNLDETGTTPNLHINPSYASTLSNIQTAIADEDKDYEINKNAIGICTNNFNSGAEEQDTYYTLKSSLGFNLDSSNYYKIVIYVFTAELNSSKEDVKQEDIGASIGLTSFDSKFTNIQTGENWEKYAFYIKPSSTVTSYLEFSLGSEATPCTGKAFFANIIFDPIEEDEFNKFDNTANANVKVLNQVTTNNDADTDTDDNNTDNEEQNNNSQAWIYAIPSILFAIAIVICVVGVMARKVKWKKPSRKTKNDYDRNRTVSKQYYSRKATQLREEKLTDLNKQLNNLIAERTKFEEDYKKDLNKLRQLKINRAPAAEINALDKDMRKNRRLSANVGVNINKVNGEIEFTKSEQYLNMLIKKLSNEAKTSNVVEESEKADANTTNKENEKK